MARGVRIGSKADTLKNLRALLRVARDRSPQKSVRESKFAQEILAQVRPAPPHAFLPPEIRVRLTSVFLTL